MPVQLFQKFLGIPVCIIRCVFQRASENTLPIPTQIETDLDVIGFLVPFEKFIYPVLDFFMFRVIGIEICKS